MDYIEDKPKTPYVHKPLEGALWISDPREYKDALTKEKYDVIRGIVADENGKQFYISAFKKTARSDGREYLRLKLKSKDEVDASREQQI